MRLRVDLLDGVQNLLDNRLAVLGRCLLDDLELRLLLLVKLDANLVRRRGKLKPTMRMMLRNQKTKE